MHTHTSLTLVWLDPHLGPFHLSRLVLGTECGSDVFIWERPALSLEAAVCEDPECPQRGGLPHLQGLRPAQVWAIGAHSVSRVETPLHPAGLNMEAQGALDTLPKTLPGSPAFSSHP